MERLMKAMVERDMMGDSAGDYLLSLLHKGPKKFEAYGTPGVYTLSTIQGLPTEPVIRYDREFLLRCGEKSVCKKMPKGSCQSPLFDPDLRLMHYASISFSGLPKKLREYPLIRRKTGNRDTIDAPRCPVNVDDLQAGDRIYMDDLKGAVIQTWNPKLEEWVVKTK